MLAAMVFFAARDPVRNVANIDALTMGLCILAVTPLVSLWMLDIQSIYPGHLVWAGSVIRLAMASLLYYLRPRETQWKPAGDF
jgi:hypothetical protein